MLNRLEQLLPISHSSTTFWLRIQVAGIFHTVSSAWGVRFSYIAFGVPPRPARQVPRTGVQPAARFADAAFPAGPKAIDGAKDAEEAVEKQGKEPKCRCDAPTTKARVPGR